jgi:tight adherence protein B
VDLVNLLAAIIGAVIVSAIILMVSSLQQKPPAPTRPKVPVAERWAKITRRPGGTAGRNRDLKLLVGVGAGFLAWLISGWVIAVPLVPLALFGVPALLKDPSQHEIKQFEAIAQWVRSLRGQLTVGAGIEHAIQVSVSSAPAPIRPEVEMLVARLAARWDIERALRAFADELGSETGDRVAMALIAGAKLRGPGLADMLDTLSEAISSIVGDKAEVESDLAKPRASARIVTLVTVGVLGVAALMRDYMRPFTTPGGQVLLTIELGAYVACLVWMRTIVATKRPPRLMQKVDQ